MKGSWKKSVAAAICVIAVALLSPGASQASTRIVSGNITLSDGFPGTPEDLQFIANGCKTNIASGQFHADINLKPYTGQTIRITQTGADVATSVPGITVLRFPTCGPDAFPGMTTMGFVTASTPLTMVVRVPAIALYAPWPANVGQNYKIELLS